MAKEFTAYEYKEVTAEGTDTLFLRDCYENFGWEIQEKKKPPKNSSDRERTVLQMRRNRRILNRPELVRLESNFEACLREKEELGRKKERNASIAAITVGIIGTACMAVSVMAFTATPPIYWLYILTAIPAILGWVLPYFLYKRIYKKESEKLEPFIAAKQDEIYAICEKGNRLLNG